jgi:hypothetical protein
MQRSKTFLYQKRALNIKDPYRLCLRIRRSEKHPKAMDKFKINVNEYRSNTAHHVVVVVVVVVVQKEHNTRDKQ